MKVILAMRKRLSNLEQKISELQSKKTDFIKEMMDKCPHPIEQIVEGQFQPEGIITSAKPSFRVCRLCGYAEEGWGYYYKLAPGSYNGIPHLSREEAWKLVVKFHSRSQLYEMQRSKDQ